MRGKKHERQEAGLIAFPEAGRYLQINGTTVLQCRIVIFYRPQVSATIWRIAFVSVSSGQLNK
jgi:hypothetical protein